MLDSIATAAVETVPDTPPSPIVSVHRGAFIIEKHKAIKQGKERWEKHAFETLPNGDRRERRLGAWSLSIPVRFLPDPERPEFNPECPEYDPKAAALEVKALEVKALTWLEHLRWVWNDALSKLTLFDSYHTYNRADKCFYPCSPLVLRSGAGDDEIRFPITDRTYKWLDVTDWAVVGRDCLIEVVRQKPDGTVVVRRLQAALSTPYSVPRKRAKRSKFRPSCPVLFPPLRPELFVLRGISEIDLANAFTQKRYLERHPDHNWFKAIPAQAVRGVLKNLAEAWSKWRYPKPGDQRPGRPHFKSASKGDRIASLAFEDAKAIVPERSSQGLLLTYPIPKLCSVHIPADYAHKWGHLPVQNLTLVHEDGWHLSLTTTERVLPLEKQDNRTAIVQVVGKDGVLCTFNGKTKTVQTAKYLALQAEIDTLKAQRDRQKVAAAKLKDDPNYKGTHLAATIAKLQKLQRQLRLSARNEIVKLANDIVQKGGNLAVAEILHTPILKPAPIPDDPAIPSWHPNNAALVAARNREKTQHRTGLFVSKLKEKSDEFGRTITVSKPPKPEKKQGKRTQKTKKV